MPLTPPQSETPEFLMEEWVGAPPDEVWAYFTVAEKLSKWQGTRAELDPRPGGKWRCEYPDGAVISGEFVALKPPGFLSYTWGFECHSDRSVYDWARPNFTPPGQSRVEIRLIAADGGTRVQVKQTHFHPDEPLQAGWGFFLGKLALLWQPAGGGAS